MEPVVVVGAGISGMACAQTVAAAGLPVCVLERSSRPGGRMASRRVDGRPVDLGASYLTVSDPVFGDQVEAWRAAGLARPWTDTFGVRDGAGAAEPKQGPLRWGAARGLRSLVEHLAEGLDVRTQVVTSVDLGTDGGPTVDGRPAPAVALAMPDPQARRLLSPALTEVAEALDDPFEPILALVATWEERRWDLDGAFVNGDDVLSWVADDGRRRGDGAPVLVAHSTPAFAAAHLEDPAAAASELVAALRRVLGVDAAPRHAMVHRWRFAKPTGRRKSDHLLHASGVGCCGDAWSTAAKVESAFLSGRALGARLVERLT